MKDYKPSGNNIHKVNMYKIKYVASCESQANNLKKLQNTYSKNGTALDELNAYY